MEEEGKRLSLVCFCFVIIYFDLLHGLFMHVWFEEQGGSPIRTITMLFIMWRYYPHHHSPQSLFSARQLDDLYFFVCEYLISLLAVALKGWYFVWQHDCGQKECKSLWVFVQRLKHWHTLKLFTCNINLQKSSPDTQWQDLFQENKSIYSLSKRRRASEKNITRY